MFIREGVLDMKKLFNLKDTKVLVALSLMVAVIGGVQVYNSRDVLAAFIDQPETINVKSAKSTKNIETINSDKNDSSASSQQVASSSSKQSSSVTSTASQVHSSQAKASQTSSKAQTVASSSSQTTNTSTQAASTQAATASSQASSSQTIPTSGFYLNGHTYPIKNFSGTGSVPADGNVYAWTSLPNYYLFERAGLAHSQLSSLTVGSKVVINGQVMHVTEVLHGVKNDGAGLGLVSKKLAQHSAGWQTCEQASYNSTLTIWFADR